MSKTDCIRTIVLLFDEHVYICIGEYVVVLYNTTCSLRAEILVLRGVYYSVGGCQLLMVI